MSRPSLANDEVLSDNDDSGSARVDNEKSNYEKHLICSDATKYSRYIGSHRLFPAKRKRTFILIMSKTIPCDNRQNLLLIRLNIRKTALVGYCTGDMPKFSYKKALVEPCCKTCTV